MIPPSFCIHYNKKARRIKTAAIVTRTEILSKETLHSYCQPQNGCSVLDNTKLGYPIAERLRVAACGLEMVSECISYITQQE